MPPTPGHEPQRQPVHADADFAHPTHPFALVVNVPLVGNHRASYDWQRGAFQDWSPSISNFWNRREILP